MLGFPRVVRSNRPSWLFGSLLVGVVAAVSCRGAVLSAAVLSAAVLSLRCCRRGIIAFWRALGFGPALAAPGRPEEQ